MCRNGALYVYRTIILHYLSAPQGALIRQIEMFGYGQVKCTLVWGFYVRLLE
jgi:hypothetical protein